MPIEMIIGVIMGVIVGTAASEISLKARRKKDLKKYLKGVELTEEQRRTMEKFLGEPLPSKYDGIGKVLADDVLERRGLKEPQWPEGPEMIEEGDVTFSNKHGIVGKPWKKER